MAVFLVTGGAGFIGSHLVEALAARGDTVRVIDDLNPAVGGWAHGTDTLNVLNAAREAGVRRVIYASNGSVYAHPNALHLKESDPILPLSPYAFAKLTGEHQC